MNVGCSAALDGDCFIELAPVADETIDDDDDDDDGEIDGVCEAPPLSMRSAEGGLDSKER